MNKYEKWYKDITKRGQTRLLETYTEIHHITPRSLGGSDSKENITKLTAREHFICHWLLIKIYKTGEEHWKMLNALRIMRAENKNQNRYKTKITSRVYQQLKEEYSKLQSERVKGEKNPMYGKIPSEKIRQQSRQRVLDDNPAKRPGAGQKISESKKGVKRGEFNTEWRKNLSKNHKSKKADFDGSLSEETRLKISESMKGRKQTDEEKLARSIANRGKKREKKLCPHCGEHVAVNTYPRWHGGNCNKKV